MVLSWVPTDTDWHGAVNALTVISSEKLRISWPLPSRAGGKHWGCSAWSDEVWMLLEEQWQLEFICSRPWALRMGLPRAQKGLNWA